jgi:hypothetical protein|tara:strand:+ start:303 stop:626 length:324 start_codon:yes stop_codon:yes gene_type:complete
MGKLYILIFSFIFSLSTYCQDGLTDRARKISNEMTMVLSLDEVTSEKIYHIQLKRFIDAQKIRNIHQNDNQQMKAELRKLQNRLWGKLNAILGEEKMKAWGAHKKNI